jgi:hypothetical protein
MLRMLHNIIWSGSKYQTHTFLNFSFLFLNKPDDDYIFQPKHVADFPWEVFSRVGMNILYF